MINVFPQSLFGKSCLVVSVMTMSSIVKDPVGKEVQALTVSVGVLMVTCERENSQKAKEIRTRNKYFFLTNI